MNKNISETKQRFSIKKFKVGAASVLVGTVFAAFANQAQVAANVDSELNAPAVAEAVSSPEEAAPQETPLEQPVAKPRTVSYKATNTLPTNGSQTEKVGEGEALDATAAFRNNTTAAAAPAPGRAEWDAFVQDDNAPESANKVGYGNNPANGFFEDALGFENADMSGATTHSKRIGNQESHVNETKQLGPSQKNIGPITYNWKEKEVTEVGGWTVANGEKIKVVEPLEPTDVAPGRDSRFNLKAKVYEGANHLTGENSQEVAAPGTSRMRDKDPRSEFMVASGLTKYIELGKKGKTIYKEYNVNPNARLAFSVEATSIYGIARSFNGGGIQTGEKVNVTLYDAEKYAEAQAEQKADKKQEKLKQAIIRTVADKIGGRVDTHSYGGAEQDSPGWFLNSHIYKIPSNTSKIRVEIAAGEPAGTIDGAGHKRGVDPEQQTNGYLIRSVGLLTLPSLEIKTDVLTSADKLTQGAVHENPANKEKVNQKGKYGEDNLYKAEQYGKFTFDVRNVGAIALHHADDVRFTVRIPEGVELDLTDRIIDSEGNISDKVYVNRVTNTPISNIGDDGSPKEKGMARWGKYVGRDSKYNAATRTLTFRAGVHYERVPGAFHQTDNPAEPGKKINNHFYDPADKFQFAGQGVGKFEVPFKTAEDYKGRATFTVNAEFGLHQQSYDITKNKEFKYIRNLPLLGLYSDAQRLDNFLAVDFDKKNQYHKDTVDSAVPGHAFGKTIYIDSVRPAAPLVEAVHTDGITGESAKKNQDRTVLVGIPDTVDVNNDSYKLKVTFPGGQVVELTRDTDGTWKNGANAVQTKDGKLIIPVPASENLHVLTDTEPNRDEKAGVITAILTDKAGNDSKPGLGRVINEAPEVEVAKPFTLRLKSATPVTNEELKTIGGVTSTDLEDDRDADTATNETVAVTNNGGFNPDAVGIYTITVQATDSDSRKSTEKTFQIQIVDPAELTRTVTRTINYEYAPGQDKTGKAAEPVVQTVTFTRRIKDDGTGFTDWTPAKQTFPSQDSPEVQGYTPSDAVIQQSPEISPDAENTVITVLYTKEPEAPVAEPQRATITLKKEGEANPVFVEKSKGNPGEPVGTADTLAKLAELKQQGYVVLSSDLPDNPLFDNVAETETGEPSQNYTIVVKEPVVDVPVGPKDPGQPVGPNNPIVPLTPGSNEPIKPGQPINPNNPEGPKWTEDKINEITREISKVNKRTVSYVKEGTTEEVDPAAHPARPDQVVFTRPFTIRGVDQTVTYGEWTPVAGKSSLKEEVSPVIPGYLLKGDKVVAEQPLTPDSPAAEDVAVPYAEIGKYVPNYPTGAEPKDPATGKPLDPAKTFPYPNDPEDPTQIGNDLPKIPYVPGFIPVGPDNNPLVPVNPEEPSRGYIPPVPANPGEDTPITYEKAPRTATITYVDENGKELSTPTPVRGQVGDDVPTDAVPDKVTELEQQGYERVPNEEKGPEGKTFGEEPGAPVYQVIFKEKVVPLDPKDPSQPRPGQPVDPTKPNGPVWPEPKVPTDPTKPVGPDNPLKPVDPNSPDYPYAQKATEKPVTRTIAYEDEAGVTLKPTDTQSVTATRTAKVNLVTGEVTYTPWQAEELPAQPAPAIAGYIAKTSGVPAQPVDGSTDSFAEKIVYAKIGKYVPNVPAGYPVPELPSYDNDPKDPSKAVPPTTPIPDVENLIPVGPTGPLTPVDPADPSRGYNPPTPVDPIEPTVITYVEKGNQVALIKYVEEGSNKVITTDAPLVGRAGEPIPGNTAPTIQELEQRGYELVRDGFAEASDAEKVFDKKPDEKAVSQEFTVVLRPKTSTVTEPKKPGTPIDPSNPDGPKWPSGLDESDLNKTVKRTIGYVDESGIALRGADEQTVTAKRTATVNHVTGEVTYTPWQAEDLPAKDAPVIDGYVVKVVTAEGVPVPGTVVPAQPVDGSTPSYAAEVVYAKIGQYVPELPATFTGDKPVLPPYANDPEDPSKAVPPTTPIPYVPGLIPLDPSGEPLTPVDPADPKKGYTPPAPTVPNENTPIRYVEGPQKAIITFVDENGKQIPGTEKIEENGPSNGTISSDKVDEKLEELKKKGYVVTPGKNPFADKANPPVFDDNDDVDQIIPVEVTIPKFDIPVGPQDPGQPVGPNNPIVPLDPETNQPIKPGQPINPNNPEGPKWTEELIQDVTKNIARSVTRTITYVKDDQSEAAPTKSQSVTFTRPFTINGVTSEVSYGTWSPRDGKDGFDKVDSPVIPSYIADKGHVPALPGLLPTSPNVEEVVTYSPISKYVPKVPAGYPTPELPSYENDPKDPSRAIPPTTDTIPELPGTVPVGPDGPLTPVDPADPSKGYIPPAPKVPTQPTVIVYVEKGDQVAIVTYKEKDSDKTLDTDTVIGKPGQPIEADTATKIGEWEKRGYELVSNGYETASTEEKVFDEDDSKTQTFTVVLQPKVVPVVPTTPNDPAAPKPGQPVEPGNPNSPVWPDSVKDLVTTKTVTRTVEYVTSENGTETVVDTYTDEVNFTRTAKVNLVTGEVTYGEWVATDGDTTFDGRDTPVLPGYVADKDKVETLTGLTAESADVKEKVVYKPIGKYVPNVPDGFTEPTLPSYGNDPKDPRKVVPPTTPIPHVPGTTPVGPDGPLTPVKPGQPDEGYTPPAPVDGSVDTPIVYVVEGDGSAIVTFVDESTATPLAVKVVSGKPGTPIVVDTESTIRDLENRGYELVRDGFTTASDTEKVFDKDPETPRRFVVTLRPKTSTVTEPKKPGTPIDPRNPDGPKWPDGLGESDLNKTITRTIVYVGTDGREMTGRVVQSVAFTRTAKVNHVTGEVVYGPWTSENDTYSSVVSPILTGFVADKGVVDAEKVAATDEDSLVRVVYSPLGNVVVTDPNGKVTVTPYPNHPTDPTKPSQPTNIVPEVPGTVPVGPDGQPLKPVDPADPSKGYYPPAIDEDNPGKDTPVRYVPVKPSRPGRPGYPGVPGGRPGDDTPETPGTPGRPAGETPSKPGQPTPAQPGGQTPAQPATPATPAPGSGTPAGGTSSASGKETLPNTGESSSAAMSALGLVALTGGMALAARKRRKG